MKTIFLVILIMAGCISLRGQSLSISKSVVAIAIDAPRSAEYHFRGTIGQLAAGWHTGQQLRVLSGFWTPYSPGTPVVILRDNGEKGSRNLTIYPNPASGSIEIGNLGERPEELPADAAVMIYNTAGQCVAAVARSSPRFPVVDISALPPGLYLVRIQDRTGKFIVAK